MAHAIGSRGTTHLVIHEGFYGRSQYDVLPIVQRLESELVQIRNGIKFDSMEERIFGIFILGEGLELQEGELQEVVLD